MASVLKENAFAGLDLLARIARFEHAHPTATTMEAVSTSHALARRVGPDLIAHLSHAQLNAPEMDIATMERAIANPVLQDSTAHSQLVHHRAPTTESVFQSDLECNAFVIKDIKDMIVRNWRAQLIAVEMVNASLVPAFALKVGEVQTAQHDAWERMGCHALVTDDALKVHASATLDGLDTLVIAEHAWEIVVSMDFVTTAFACAKTDSKV